MKKYIIFIVAALSSLFIACTNQKEIDLEYTVNITVDPSTVLESFNGISVNNQIYGLDMDEGCDLLITTLLYDEEGILIDKKEFTVADYDSIVQYPILSAKGREYTLVTITYSVDNSYDELIHCYSISNEDSLERLMVESNWKNGNSYYSNWTMLGLACETINTDELSHTVKVQAASAIIKLSFYDIHTWDESGIDSQWIAYKNNEAAYYRNGEFTFNTESGVNSGWMYSLDVTANDSNNIFAILNLLPTENMTLWGGFNMGDIESSYSDFLEYAGLDPSYGKANITIEAGCEYLFEVYCESFEVHAAKMTRSTDNSIADKVETVKKTEDEINYKYIPTHQSANVIELYNLIKH